MDGRNSPLKICFQNRAQAYNSSNLAQCACYVHKDLLFAPAPPVRQTEPITLQDERTKQIFAELSSPVLVRSVGVDTRGLQAGMAKQALKVST